MPQEELLRFNNHFLNYGGEARLDELPAAGLSPDYVSRETQRALAGVQGKCRVLPGIDIGIPTGKNSRQASPEDTYAATLAALKAGAHGMHPLAQVLRDAAGQSHCRRPRRPGNHESLSWMALISAG